MGASGEVTHLRSCCRQRKQILLPFRLHLPQRTAAMMPQRIERAGLCQHTPLVLWTDGSAKKILKSLPQAWLALRDDVFALGCGEPLRSWFRPRRSTSSLLDRATHFRSHHAHRPDAQAVLLRIAHQRGRRIEAHRLVVQQRGRELRQCDAPSATRWHKRGGAKLMACDSGKP